MLLTLGCGPSPAAVDTDGGSSTNTDQETHTSTAGATTVVAGGSSTRDGGPPGGDWGGCPRGSRGCPCEVGECGESLECQEGICGPSPQCGDGQLQAPEVCDDGNNDVGDGCSDLCIWERHCFVGQLGDGRGTIRTITIDRDGLLARELDRDLPPHQPAPVGLSRATENCGHRLVHAMHTAGVVVSLRPFDTLPPDSSGSPLPGVLELACTDEALLFATVRTTEGFELQLFDVSQGLVPLETRVLDATGPPRLALDEQNERLWLAMPGDALQLASLSYAGLTFGPLDPLVPQTSLTNADDLVWVPSLDALLVASGRLDQQTTLVSAGFDMVAATEPPWTDRHNIIELADGAFAMGGAAGVVVGSIDDSNTFTHAATLAPDLSNTLVRTAMHRNILVVASPTEFRTFRSDAPDMPWQELDRLQLEDTPQLEAGDVVVCP